MPQTHRDAKLFCVSLLGSLAVTAFLRTAFHDSPPPRFGDPFLIGVLFLAYKTSSQIALLMLAIAVLLSIWLLAPLDSTDTIQIASFIVLSLLIVWITRTLRGQRTS